MYTIVFLRHGESLWNRENRFTGWTDVDLTPGGEEEARHAADQLAQRGLSFDLAFTSVLRRAVKTLWIVLEKLDLMWIPVVHSWRLNERHYGALQGLNKAETAARFGEAQVHLWRRSYDVRPPALTPSDPRYEGANPRYRDLTDAEKPLTESLKDTVARVVPYWHETLVPAVRAGRRIVVSAHGNSLRALLKHLDGISDTAIADLDIPTGIPLVYELDADLRPLRHEYLGDPEAVRRASAKVADQGKAR